MKNLSIGLVFTLMVLSAAAINWSCQSAPAGPGSADALATISPTFPAVVVATSTPTP